MDDNHDFIHPTKILWVFPAPEPESPWETNIPSKTVRNVYKNLDTILADSRIQIDIQELTTERYIAWHTYYARIMKSQDHEVLAGIDWFERRTLELDKIWIIEATGTNNDILGGSIISVDTNGVFTHHFKATERISIAGPANTSLGILLEFLYLRFAFQNDPQKVTSGLSRNGFGFFNTLGYLASKLRMGYVPHEANDRPWDNEFLVKESAEPTIWFIKRDTHPLVAWVHPNADKLPSEIKTYFERLHIPYASSEASI
jgi:hypothetical protein